MKKLYKKFKLKQIADNPDETVNDVKKQLLFWIIFIICILGIPITIIGIIESFLLGQNIALLSYILFFGFIITAAVFRKKMSFKLTAAIIVLSIYSIGVFNLIIYGFNGAAIPLFFTFLVLISIFFNLKTAIWGISICIVPMIIIGYLFLNGLISLDISLQDLSVQPVAWLTSTAVLFFMGTLIILSIGIIQKKMYHSLELSKQQAKELQAANERLQKDILKRKEIEHELIIYKQQLEGMVKERTQEIDNLNEELKASNEELNTSNEKLKESNKDLEEFNDLFIGREFRIKELRDELKKYKNTEK